MGSALIESFANRLDQENTNDDPYYLIFAIAE